MKKLFISQPMKDKTDEEIKAVREEAIRRAKEKLGEDVEVYCIFELFVLKWKCNSKRSIAA